jgi:hypothetical protein
MAPNPDKGTAVFKGAISARGTSGWFDLFAVVMSMICAVHCLVTPIIIGVLPMLATTFWSDQHFHLWMLVLVVPTAVITGQVQAHCANCAAPENGDLFTGATVANMIGAAFLTTAHVRNFLQCRRARCSHCPSG